MLRWLPFIGRAVHGLIVARLEGECNELERRLSEALVRETYWRSRAEKLNDQLLARAGMISEPTMVDRKPANTGAQGGIFAGMSVSEIESGKA